VGDGGGASTQRREHPQQEDRPTERAPRGVSTHSRRADLQRGEVGDGLQLHAAVHQQAQHDAVGAVLGQLLAGRSLRGGEGGRVRVCVCVDGSAAAPAGRGARARRQPLPPRPHPPTTPASNRCWMARRRSSSAGATGLPLAASSQMALRSRMACQSRVWGLAPRNATAGCSVSDSPSATPCCSAALALRRTSCPPSWDSLAASVKLVVNRYGGSGAVRRTVRRPALAASAVRLSHPAASPTRSTSPQSPAAARFQAGPLLAALEAGREERVAKSRSTLGFTKANEPHDMLWRPQRE
jgi:hypothetical protein